VPLDHPGRDRQRGRIWRIIYTGVKPHAPPATPRPDWSAASAEDLISDLDHANFAVRLLATNELVDRVGAKAIEPLKMLMQRDPTPVQMRHALWTLYRLGALDDSMLVSAMR